MKNEIVKVKHVTTIQEKLKEFYLQVISDACVKKAALEICFEKNTKECVVGPYENICTIAAHCWYIEDPFPGFCWHVFEKNVYFRRHASG